MRGQSRHWVFTVNNWTQENDDALKALASTVTYIVYGYETGEEGTPHLQGYVIFEAAKRFNQVQALLPRGAHIEIKRGSPSQAAEYCKKGGLFTEEGTVPKQGVGGQFDNFVSWVHEYHREHGQKPSMRDICALFPSLFVRYGKRLEELIEYIVPSPELETAPLRDWQVQLHEIIVELEPDNREILFFVDPDGGKGKSYFQRWMLTRYPKRVQLLGIGKRDDIAHTIDVAKDIFLVNVPRTDMDKLQYTILEQLKDRVVFSPKYNSTVKVLKRVPWVIVFSNENPDTSKMTMDRYVIQEL